MSIAEVTRTDSPVPEGAHPSVVEWVDQIAALTLPDDVVWCDGSMAEWDGLANRMV